MLISRAASTVKKRKKQDQSAPQAAQVSQPHTQPPATSTFSAALSLTAVAPAAQTASIAAAQLARVPAPSPPPPELRVSSTSAGSLKRPASEPFAGKRSAKRQARLANQWGLTVVSSFPHLERRHCAESIRGWSNSRNQARAPSSRRARA